MLAELPAGQRCQRLLLVGGFAESPALGQRMREEFEGPGGVERVVVPNVASAAVLQGRLMHSQCMRPQSEPD